MAEQWMSIVEYARTFQVSDMTVRRRIKTGKLHAVLKEGKYFIPVAQQAQVSHASHASQQAPSFPRREEESVRKPQSVIYPKRPGEMTVIKGHPSAQNTYGHIMGVATQPQVQAPRQQQVTQNTPRHAQPLNDYSVDGQQDTIVPQNLSRPLDAQDTSLVDTRALLAFCEASLRKLNDSERRTVEKFKSKLEAVEANLVARDHEIKSLRQQVEDLQLLVKILERKS